MKDFYKDIDEDYDGDKNARDTWKTFIYAFSGIAIVLLLGLLLGGLHG